MGKLNLYTYIFIYLYLYNSYSYAFIIWEDCIYIYIYIYISCIHIHVQICIQFYIWYFILILIFQNYRWWNIYLSLYNQVYAVYLLPIIIRICNNIYFISGKKLIHGPYPQSGGLTLLRFFIISVFGKEDSTGSNIISLESLRILRTHNIPTFVRQERKNEYMFNCKNRWRDLGFGQD